MIVAVPPGGPADTLARLVAPRLTDALGQTVVIDNRPGANGIIAYETTARATPDGHTFTAVAAGVVINPSLYRNVNYDPVKDFAPITLGITVPNILVVHPSVPAASVKELIALAKVKPGSVTFASAGNGTSGHLAGEMLAQRLGGKMIHVPYKEGAVAMTSVMSHQVDFMFYHPAAVMPQIKAGKLRALGASGAVRSAAAPEVPTLMEQGVKDFDLVAWFMLYAPAATPPATLAQLRSASASALAQPEAMARLKEQGIEQRPMRVDEMAPFNQVELGKWAELVKRSGAQVD